MKNERGYRLKHETYKSSIWCLFLEKITLNCVKIIPKRIYVRYTSVSRDQNSLLAVQYTGLVIQTKTCDNNTALPLVVVLVTCSARINNIINYIYWVSQAPLGFLCFQIGCAFVKYDLFNTTNLVQNLT